MTRIEAEQLAYIKTRNFEDDSNWIAKRNEDNTWRVVPFNIHLNKNHDNRR